MLEDVADESEYGYFFAYSQRAVCPTQVLHNHLKNIIFKTIIGSELAIREVITKISGSILSSIKVFSKKKMKEDNC